MFLLQKGEIEGRLDPFFYKSEFVELEKRVKAKSTLVLRDFVLNMASGATPLTTESDKYYVENADEGIPFLRVQNLTTEGVLNITDCKYINLETHETMLKRSQVNEGNLLVKITGVGRMAIASVAPEGFIGNINQHVVVIKTEDRRTSEILAAYLNTDIAEKLATRRSTGGTRPALDYPALLSLPIVFDERVLEIMQNKVAEKQAALQNAQTLLSSIDTYLLDKLGIQQLPHPSVNLSERVFLSQFNDIDGVRIDPHFHKNEFKILENHLNSGRYKHTSLKIISTKITSGATPKSGGDDYVESSFGIPFIRSGEINEFDIIDFDKCIYIKPEIHNGQLNSSKLKKGDLMIAIVGATIGQVGVFAYDIEANINQAIALIRFDEKTDSEFVKSFYLSSLGQKVLDRAKRPVARANINLDEIGSLSIIHPPLSIQQEIATHIRNLRIEAQTLQVKAEAAIKEAKLEIENILLI